MWELIKLNLDWGATSNKILNYMNELNKFRLNAFESSGLYKEKMNKYHYEQIENHEFPHSDFVLLFNSMLRCFMENTCPSRPDIQSNPSVFTWSGWTQEQEHNEVQGKWPEDKSVFV